MTQPPHRNLKTENWLLYSTNYRQQIAAYSSLLPTWYLVPGMS